LRALPRGRGGRDLKAVSATGPERPLQDTATGGIGDRPRRSGQERPQLDGDCPNVPASSDPVGDALAAALERWRRAGEAPLLRRARVPALAELEERYSTPNSISSPCGSKNAATPVPVGCWTSTRITPIPI